MQLPGPEMTNIVQYWRATVARFPNKPAAVYEGNTYTYAETDRLSGSMAEALTSRFGLSDGDPVAISMPNSIEHFLA